MKNYQLYINGEWLDAESGETFESTNPAKGESVATIQRGGQADIDKAVLAARKAFDEGPWPAMSGEERAEALTRIAELIDANAKPLTQLIIEESGSTFKKAKGEVWLSGKHMGWFARLAKADREKTIESLSKPGVSRNIIVREPIGVCGQIIPWNFPLQMMVWKIGPALAAGNTVVLKPAEETSAVAMELTRLIDEAKILPPGVLNVVTGIGEEAGAPLVKHPLVDKIAFTGSTEVGKIIMRDAAETLKRVTLELGGKSANIVLDDADLDMAVDAALYAVFFHSGQCCTAGTRLLVQEGIYDEFTTRLKERAAQIHGGEPSEKASDMGPLVSQKQVERVERYIRQGEKEGASILFRGDKNAAGGCYVPPVIFKDVDNTMTIAREEIFGPVMSVLPFKTEADAIRIANDSPYGLAGAVWSQDREKALRVARKLKAGTVWVNEYHLISERAPFGGYKQSGVGRELGEDALDAYLETKHIHIDEIGDRAKKFWYDAVVPLETIPRPMNRKLLLSIFLLILLAGAGIAIWQSTRHETPMVTELPDNNATVVGQNVSFTVTEGETKKWVIEAEKAIYNDDQSEADLEKVSGRFFNDKGEPVLAFSAPKGHYANQKNAVVLTGVVAKSITKQDEDKQAALGASNELRAPRMSWNAKSNEVLAEGGVKVDYGKMGHSTADQARFSLDFTAMSLMGNVKSEINY